MNIRVLLYTHTHKFYANANEMTMTHLKNFKRRDQKF